MPAFDISIPSMDKLQARLKQSPQITERYLQQAIEASGAEVHKHATRENVPWKTGNLVQSFGVVLGRLFASIAPDRSSPAGYAIYVHEGTAPHVILPKNGRALFWPGAAHPVSKVNHPGTKPNRFMPRIIEKAQPQIEQHFKKALDLIASKLAGL